MATISENVEASFGVKTEGIPPVDTPIVFLAGEFGCNPEWYIGFCFQSSLEGQGLGFYIYSWFLGFPANYPGFHAPPYKGFYRLIVDTDLLAFIKKNQGG